MADLTCLPLELLFEILSYLPRIAQLKATSLVCSKLRAPSQQLLTRCIRIGYDLKPSRDPRVKSLLEIIPPPPTYPPFDCRRQLLAFVRLLLARPQSFSGVRELRLRARREEGSGWLNGWKMVEGGTRVAVPNDSTEPREEDRSDPFEQKQNPLGHHQYLTPGASALGISPGMVAYYPLSAAFLIILHLIPGIRHLCITETSVILPTLSLAALGHLSGGIPSCLRNITSLRLGEWLDKWRHSPTPLLAALPSLNSLCSSGLKGGLESRYNQLLPPTSLKQLSSTVPSRPRLSDLAFDQGLVTTDELTRILSFSVNVKSLNIRQEVLGPLPTASTFDIGALFTALKPHLSSLHTLKLYWNLTRLDRIVDSPHPLLQFATINLVSFTSLKHLTVNAVTLFGNIRSFNNPEPSSVFAHYLPSSLETLNIRLYHTWNLGGFTQAFNLISAGLWLKRYHFRVYESLRYRIRRT